MNEVRTKLVCELANVQSSLMFCRDADQRYRYEVRIDELRRAIKDFDQAEQDAKEKAYRLIRSRPTRQIPLGVMAPPDRYHQSNERFGTLHLTAREIDAILNVFNAYGRFRTCSDSPILTAVRTRLRLLRDEVGNKKPSGS